MRTATEARKYCSRGKPLLSELPVEFGSGGVARLRAGFAGMTTVVGGSGSGDHSARGFCIPVSDLFAKIGVSHQLTTS